MTWAAARQACLVGLGAVGVGLWWSPQATTTLFWWGIVPLLPAVFLVHPGVWRNVCPVATLSMGRREGASAPGAATAPAPWAGAAGVLPFLLLVGWRGTGLEAQPAGTGALLAGLVGVAVVAGRRGHRRDGFCNRWCPLLPVERLYGQRPLRDVPDVRCPTCTLCTPRGCLDLSPTAATAQLLGPGRTGPDWLLTPFGAFAAGLPGFVTAYFLVTPVAGPGAVARLAGALSLGLAVSWTVVSMGVRWAGIPWRTALPTLAGAAVLAYYGFSLPRSVAALHGPPVLASLLQACAALGVAAWWVRAVRVPPGSRRRPAG